MTVESKQEAVAPETEACTGALSAAIDVSRVPGQPDGLGTGNEHATGISPTTETVDAEATERPETYFAELASALAMRGVEAEMAEQAIGQLEHGLAGSRSPDDRYGPVHKLADAVVVALSADDAALWRVVVVVGLIAAHVAIVAAAAFANPAGVVFVFGDDGYSTRLPSNPGDLLISPLGLASASWLSVAYRFGRIGRGYLVPLPRWQVNRVGFGSRDASRDRPTSKARPALTVVGVLGAAAALKFAPLGMDQVFSTDHGNAYLVAPGTLWTMLIPSALVAATCLGGFFFRRRVRVVGEAGFLLRTWGDGLHPAPGYWDDTEDGPIVSWLARVFRYDPDQEA